MGYKTARNGGGFQTVEEMWQDYAKAVFTGMTPGRTQYHETRKAFIAGILHTLEHLVDVADNATEDEGTVLLETLKQDALNEAAKYLSNQN